MERVFGEIPGIPEGSEFENRHYLSVYGVHWPIQAGISGSQTEGADSIVLSGGYADDEDLGDEIIYTGHGGRSIETGLQVADQQLTHQNLALALNSQTGLPVRVIRGYNHKSLFSPQSGYRYDGLYRVDSYWKEKGVADFFVWRFRLLKITSLLNLNMAEEDQSLYKKTPRVETTILRIIRDTTLGKHIKELYKYQCQVCRTSVRTNIGPYVEAAHIRPLGKPHDGLDNLSNMLCLCPNHHVMFDFGGFSLTDDLGLLGIDCKLHVNKNHHIRTEYIQYHRSHFYGNST